jgi:HEAT repeat protein
MVLLAQWMALSPENSALAILLGAGAFAGVLAVCYFLGWLQALFGALGARLRAVVRWGFETWRRWLSWASAWVFTGLAIGCLVLGVKIIDDFTYLSIVLGLATFVMGVVTCLAYVHLDMERDEVERGYKSIHNPLKGQDPARDLAMYGGRVGLFYLVGSAISAIGGFALLNQGIYWSFGEDWYRLDAGRAGYADFVVYSLINLYRVVDLLDLANHHRLVNLAHLQPVYWPASALLAVFKTFFTFVLLQQIVASIRAGNLLSGTIADFFNPHQVIHERARDGLAGFGVSALKPLLSFVRHGEPLSKEQRSDLVTILAGMGPAAIPALIDRIDDPSDEVRAVAIETLGRLHAVQALGDFAELGSDANDQVRISRVAAIGHFLDVGVHQLRKRQGLFLAWQKSPRRWLRWRARRKRHRDPVIGIVEQLRECLRDPLSEVRVQAAAALADLGPEALRAAADVQALLDDADAAVRAQAALALGTMGSAAAKAPLVKCLADDNVAVRAAAVDALGALQGEAASAIVELVALLNDRDETVRSKAAEVLGSGKILHASAVAQLTNDLQSPDALVRARTAEAVGNIGASAQAVVPALVEAARDANDRVRAKAIKALGKIGEGAAAAALPKLVHALRDPDPWVSSLAAEALGEMGDAADDAVPALIRSLGHDNAQVRLQAVEALGKLGPAAAPAVPHLEKLCRENDDELRATALETLGILGIRPRTQALVRDALADSNPAVRRAALGAVNRVALIPPETLDALTRVLGDEDEGVRILACEVLADKLGPDPLVVHVLTEIVGGPDHPETRAAAAALLGRLGPEALSAGPILLQAVTTGEPVVREAALRALVFLQGPDAPAAFIAGLMDEDPELRIMASAAWRKALDIPDDALPLLIRALHDPEPRVRANAAHALGRIDPIPDGAVAPLLDCARDPQDDVRLQAVIALRSALDSKPLQEALEHLLRDPHPRIRLIVADRLLTESPFHADAQSAVREGLAHAKPAVRGAALALIQKFGPIAPYFLEDLRELLTQSEGSEFHDRIRDLMAGIEQVSERVLPDSLGGRATGNLSACVNPPPHGITGGKPPVARPQENLDSRPGA